MITLRKLERMLYEAELREKEKLKIKNNYFCSNILLSKTILENGY